jgi:DNA-binding NarL/FixJ family response regulator
MNCLILEDQVILADLLAKHISSCPGVRVIAIAHSLEEGKVLCLQHYPDLLIVDLLLPDGNGIDVAEEFLERKPDTKIIILSAECHRLSCSVHLHKSIVAVVDKMEALEKLRFVMDDLCKRSQPSTIPPEPWACLTPREREVVRMIGQGLTTEAIADRLTISLHTAQTHRKNITAKLGIKGSELVVLASAIKSDHLPNSVEAAPDSAPLGLCR